MINILSLFWMQAQRQVFGARHQNKLPLLAGIILLVFTGIQIGFIHEQGEAEAALSGWFVCGFWVLYTVFGLLSNRLPGKMEDVIWLYHLHPLRKVIHAVFVWKAAWKGLIWLGSALLADWILLVTERMYAGLAVQACAVILLVAMLEYWVLAVSCARTIPSAKFFYSLLLTAIAAACGISWYAGWSQDWQDAGYWIWMERIMEQIGMMIYGRITLLCWLILLFMGIISYITIQRCARDLRCKERLVTEADFWAEFQDHQAYMAKLGTKTKETWWGFASLQGVWSFLWMEAAIARKHLFAHIVQLIILLLLIPYLIYAHIEWFYIVLGIIIAATVLSSYYSGLVRHAKSGDLFLLPGPLWKKTVIIETANTIWLWLIFLYSAAVYGLIEQVPLALISKIVLEGTGFYMLMLGIRWSAVIYTYRRSPDMPMLSYYRHYFISMICAGAVLALIYRLSLDASEWLTAIVVCMLGLTWWVSAYGYRRRTALALVFTGACLMMLLQGWIA